VDFHFKLWKEGAAPQGSRAEMWTVVQIVSGQAMAEMLKNLLSEEGFLVQIRPLGIPHLGAGRQFELLVPRSEAREAQEILMEKWPILS
jgi:hypothetical protein